MNELITNNKDNNPDNMNIVQQDNDRNWQSNLVDLFSHLKENNIEAASSH